MNVQEAEAHVNDDHFDPQAKSRRVLKGDAENQVCRDCNILPANGDGILNLYAGRDCWE
jgi:hypothetical protein